MSKKRGRKFAHRDNYVEKFAYKEYQQTGSNKVVLNESRARDLYRELKKDKHYELEFGEKQFITTLLKSSQATQKGFIKLVVYGDDNVRFKIKTVDAYGKTRYQDDRPQFTLFNNRVRMKIQGNKFIQTSTQYSWEKLTKDSIVYHGDNVRTFPGSYSRFREIIDPATGKQHFTTKEFQMDQLALSVTKNNQVKLAKLEKIYLKEELEKDVAREVRKAIKLVGKLGITVSEAEKADWTAQKTKAMVTDKGIRERSEFFKVMINQAAVDEEFRAMRNKSWYDFESNTGERDWEAYWASSAGQMKVANAKANKQLVPEKRARVQTYRKIYRAETPKAKIPMKHRIKKKIKAIRKK